MSNRPRGEPQTEEKKKENEQSKSAKVAYRERKAVADERTKRARKTSLFAFLVLCRFCPPSSTTALSPLATPAKQTNRDSTQSEGTAKNSMDAGWYELSGNRGQIVLGRARRYHRTRNCCTKLIRCLALQKVQQGEGLGGM